MSPLPPTKRELQVRCDRLVAENAELREQLAGVWSRMTSRQTAISPWEEIGVRAECYAKDCDSLKRLHWTASDAMRAAREHAEATGHEVEIRQGRKCVVRAVHRPATSGEHPGEPNPHVQRTWTPEGVV